MPTVRDLLNQVWSEFRKVGISYDLAIIEHIAAFLLEISGLEFSEDELQPKKPSQSNLNTEKVKQLLREAANTAGGAARLLDNYVIFCLPNILAGGGYPTPRHIVKSMIRLAQVEPNHSVADFACGSAGLLVNHLSERQGISFGVDISLEWARIAYANVKLHRLINTIIFKDNALEVYIHEDETLETLKSFDRILVNPPFGAKIDANLAEITFGQKVGSRSETALLTLALQKLSPNGRAAVLVPSGILFSNSIAEKVLRNQLVDDNSLEAVITFPKDAFQPYSSLQTHLLLFRKIHKSEKHLTWFCQAEYDGYPSGRGRDLTQPSSRHSDLPFLEEVIINNETNFKYPLPNSENPFILVIKIVDDTNILGVVCCSIVSEITSIDFYPQFDKKPPLLLVETAKESFCVQVPLDNSTKPSVVDNRQQFIEERTNKKDSGSSIKLLSRRVQAAAIGITPVNQTTSITTARLLGVAVSNAAIQEKSYDLRPEGYIGKQEEARLTDLPTQILTRIHRNQRELQQRLDNLFGHLEMPPIAGLQIPSQLLEVEPFGTLNEEQTIIWQKVCEKTELINPGHLENGLTATYFTLLDVETSDMGEVSDTTKQTLDLLECMGLIVPVTIADAKTGESIACYRRVTGRDLWDLESEASL